MKDYELIGPTIYLKKEEVLIIGDIHCGFEKDLRRKFGSLYLGQEEKSLKLMKEILEKIKIIKEIIFLGDITHSFIYKKNEIEEFKKIIETIKDKDKKTEIIVTKGNHDLFLKEEMFENKIKIVDFYTKKDILFVHGDKKSLEKVKKGIKKVKRIFLGHFHPAIELSDNIKKEVYKCFLIGNYNGKEYFFLPSFFPIIEGRDIRKNDEINIDLIKNLNVFAIDEEFNVYDFEKLKN
ncbi:MAG: metallophosphoesterase family protein [Candidatus Pacearchaeota archaeon]